jgi:hypothetical protein
MTDWTAPDLTDVDLAAIEACREGLWPTAGEVRKSIALGGACNDHPDTPHRVYPSRKPQQPKSRG